MPDEISSLKETIRLQEQRLREIEESEGLLRLLLESAALGVMVAVDPEGTIQYVNATTEELFGYTRQELLGAPVEILLPEMLRAQHVAHRADYFHAPRTRPMGIGMDLKGRKKDGSEFPVEISLGFMRQPQRVLAVALITDISERKRKEEHMRQSQKLESLGVLAGGVAHDFNNLLTGMMGNASLVLDGLPPGSPMYQHVEDVIHAAQHAADLTRQLLAYAGKGQFFITNVDIPALVREVAGLLHSSIPGAVRLNVELPEDLPPVSADAGQLQQLFMNLMINAAEAIAPGQPGTITVEGGEVTTHEPFPGQFPGMRVPPGRYVWVQVEDTGCGMDEATAARIFDPFFSTKFTGRGLGLAAARGIVEALHGGIRVSSAPGEGTTFTVLLPAAQADKAAPGAPVAAIGNDLSGSGVVLVVDDEEIVRHTAREALQHYGYTVLLAEDGQTAIDLMREAGRRICAVLLDLTMPGMDGVETLPQLKRLRPEVPVLLSSGFSEAEASQRFTGQDLAGFVQKPYTASQLARRIKRVCAAASG